MTTHSSILVWRIPWTDEPGILPSMGSQRVRYNWGTSTQRPPMATKPKGKCTSLPSRGLILYCIPTNNLWSLIPFSKLKSYTFLQNTKMKPNHSYHGKIKYSCTVARLPGWHSGKEFACQCRRRRRCGFDSWVGKIPWRRTWQPTPVLLPGESRGQRSLVGYSPWNHKESDAAEATEYTVHTVAKKNVLLPFYVNTVTWKLLLVMDSGFDFHHTRKLFLPWKEKDHHSF